MPCEREAAKYLRDHEADIPRIQRPERWWSPGNLMQLVCLRRMLSDLSAEPHHLDLIKMGVLGILVPGQQRQAQPRLADVRQRSRSPMIDLGAILAKKYEEMIEDLRSVAGSPCSEVTIHRGNSKQVSRVFASGADITAVITSPPYPNRFSYARETRPHLFFFDFIEGAQAVGQLETDSIGGTWGKATSVLAQGVAPANSIIESLLSPYTRNIDRDGRLMGSYVTKYFNDIFQHAEEIEKVCVPSVSLGLRDRQ